MATTVTYTQTPHIPFNMAYGPNPITLTGIDPGDDKYVLQIFKLGSVAPLADVRQTPNRVGDAIFDIQNILQTIVSPSTGNLDGMNTQFYGGDNLSIARGEIAQYQIKIGHETAGQVETINVPLTFTVLGGKQPYWMENFNTDDYIPLIQGSDDNPACTEIVREAGPLSDVCWRIEDDLPAPYSSPGGIDVQHVYRDDVCTKTFYNQIEKSTSSPPAGAVQGIEGYTLLQFNAANSLTNVTVMPNTQTQGGGPNTVPGQGTLPTNNYLLNTIATGPANIALGAIQATTTYYYILPGLLDPCSENQLPLLYDCAWRAQKYIVLEDECNDYLHVQFAWMNSKGMRDQFTFTKKSEKGVSIKRNEFLQEAADYNSNSYNVTIQDRGFTTYSQTLRETHTVTSGFMNDEEAKLLESLYTSADVMVRFSDATYGTLDQWTPVRLQSMKYTQKTNRKDRLFQYTIRFTLAHNQKSQRG